MKEQQQTLIWIYGVLFILLIVAVYFTYIAIGSIQVVRKSEIRDGGGEVEAQKLMAQYSFNAASMTVALIIMGLTIFITLYPTLAKKPFGEIFKKKNNTSWFTKEFTKKRISTALTFSVVVGVTYWATTVYGKAFESKNWWMGILAFILVAAVLLIFGRTLLDAISNK